MAADKDKLLLYRGLAAYLDTPSFSDFTITCQLKHWKVHRLVLALHSSVLAKACSSDFKEAKEARVDLDDHETEHVEALVKYMYAFDYEPIEVVPAEEGDHSWKMVFHAHMILIADKYDINGLEILATERLCAAIDEATKGDDLAAVACLAYSVDGPLDCIRQKLVIKISKERLFVTETTPAELEAAMLLYPQLALQISRTMAWSAQPVRYKEQQFGCPGVGCYWEGFKCIPDTELDSFKCPGCGGSWTGKRWQGFLEACDSDSD